MNTVMRLKINLKLLLTVFLLVVILFNVSRTLYQQRDKYFSFDYWQRYSSLKKAYYDSVYANKNGSWLPDETVYSFSGGALIKGENPILVIPEVPPTGKYLIGLSALLFNNENIIIAFCSIASLIMLFLIGKQVFHSTLIALMPLALLSFEQIFINQLIYIPLLDIIHLLFLLSSFYFFNVALKSKNHIFKFFLLTNLFLGLFISTKFFGIGASVVLAFLVVLTLNRDIRRLKLFSFTLPLSIFILLLSYVRVLALGYPLNKFLGIQKWVFLYTQGHIHSLFSVWPLFFLNQWHVAWGNTPIISDSQWSLTWPIIGVFFFITSVMYLFKKISKNKEIEILIAWVFLYFVFLSFGDANSRYFIILIPIIYLVVIFGTMAFFDAVIKKIK